MPTLTILSNKLTTPGFKKTPVLIKTYTGTDFTASHSTWTVVTGSLSLRSNTLPYHSYGNSKENTTATNQSANKTWPLRAGLSATTSSIYNYLLTTIEVEIQTTSTVIATTVTNVTTITETAVVFETASTTGLTTGTAITFERNFGGLKMGEIYYVRDLTPSTFTVAATTSSARLPIAETGTVLATTLAITRPSVNIGYWINGVNMFNPSADTEVPNGFLTFPNLNYVAAYQTVKDFSYDLNQDLAGGRVISNGAYGYHDFSFAQAWTSGTAHTGTTGPVVTTGTAEISLIPYLDNSLTHYDGHSKILGWSLDGYPVYGPYGYNQRLDPNSGVRVMISGYKTYSKVTDVIPRTIDGAVNTFSYPLGIFVQDYYYAGTGDLDVHNGRFCVTPEFPEGTYAYFCPADPVTLKPTYPYAIGNIYRSLPVGPGQTTSDPASGGGSPPKQTI
jgi:hypothetical protein